MEDHEARKIVGKELEQIHKSVKGIRNVDFIMKVKKSHRNNLS